MIAPGRLKLDGCSHRNFDGSGRCWLFHSGILKILPIPDGYVKSVREWMIRAMWPSGRIKIAKLDGKKAGRAGWYTHSVESAAADFSIVILPSPGVRNGPRRATALYFSKIIAIFKSPTHFFLTTGRG
jgi:hypothetical protein